MSNPWRPVVPVACPDCLSENKGPDQPGKGLSVLALPEVRRRVESRAPARPDAVAKSTRPAATQQQRLLAQQIERRYASLVKKSLTFGQSPFPFKLLSVTRTAATGAGSYAPSSKSRQTPGSWGSAKCGGVGGCRHPRLARWSILSARSGAPRRDAVPPRKSHGVALQQSDADAGGDRICVPRPARAGMGCAGEPDPRRPRARSRSRSRPYLFFRYAGPDGAGTIRTSDQVVASRASKAEHGFATQ